MTRFSSRLVTHAALAKFSSPQTKGHDDSTRGSQLEDALEQIWVVGVMLGFTSRWKKGNTQVHPEKLNLSFCSS